MAADKKTAGKRRVGDGTPGPGRPKGTPNKITKALKDAILEAANTAHPEGTVGYLREQAKDNPTAFMALLGKTLPLQHSGEDGGPILIVTGVRRAGD